MDLPARGVLETHSEITVRPVDSRECRQSKKAAEIPLCRSLLPIRRAEQDFAESAPPNLKPDFYRNMMGFILFFLVAGTGFSAEPRSLVTVGVGAGITVFDEEPVPMIAFGLGVEVLRWLDLQMTYAGPDTHNLTYMDPADQTYHGQPSWWTAGIRPHISLGERVEIGFPIESGLGSITYRYDTQYRDDMIWTDENLEVTTCSVTTAGIDVQFRIGKKWFLAAAAGWRITSPVRSPIADPQVLNGYFATAGTGRRF